MNMIKLFAASIAVFGVLLASPAVHAHATLNVGTGAAPVWANGTPAEWLAVDSTLPSLGYIGIHSGTNKRVIQTGVYGAAYNATTNPTGVTTADLGGVYGGATPSVGDSLQGQLYKYNTKPANAANQLPTSGSISVGANSWANGVANGVDAANTGLSFGNIHASTGTGNLEQNLINAGVSFINVTVGDDPLSAGVGQLAFSLYQGWSSGPGMQGLNLLGTVLASSVGQDIGISIALSGLSLNGAGTGEYTVVVGDQSNVGGQYRMAVAAGTSASYSTVVSAVPVPGAVWLFGSAVAGMIGFGRRKAAVTA